MAKNYDYREAVKNDVIDYINDNSILDSNTFEDLNELREYLNDNLFTCDSVTGNASGSYTFGTYEAEENLAHNWDLLEDLAAEWGGEIDITKGAEYCDVCIRCFLLPSAIDEALEEMGIDEDYPAFGCNQEDIAG